MNASLDPPASSDGVPSAVFDVARNRVFLTYGRTNERFCQPSGVEVRYEKLMHDHLARHGYQLVVFFSNRGCFFLDPHSRDLVIASASLRTDCATARPPLPAPRNGVHGKGRLLTHSTGLSLLRRNRTLAKPLLPSGRLRWADMANPTQMVPLMRRLLLQEEWPTAIVIANDDIFATFARSELNQQFQALVKHEVKALPTANRNIVIFNFPGTDPWSCLQGHRWGFLLGASPESPNGIATPVYVGEPEADEVCHFLLSQHLKHGTPLDAAAFPRLIQRLTCHLKANRHGLLALSPLTKAPRLDRAAVDRLARSGPGADRPAREQLEELIGLQSFRDYVEGKLKAVGRCRQRDTPPTMSFDVHRLVPPPPPPWISHLRLHLVLTGNPGTGKSTVARLLGELYREAGVLPLGHTIKATRADLVAGYVGQTALKIREVVQRALGGVLFVDEAYDLCRGPDDSFGMEAITALNEAMSDLNGRFAVVLAGYPKDMARLMETNAGLKSRFDGVLHLDDYGPRELEAILRRALAAHGDLVLGEELETSLTRLCESIHANRDSSFGNARAMVQLAGTLYENMVRDDADRADLRHLPAEHRALLEQPAIAEDGVLEELDSLIGLQGVKERMRTLFNRLRVEQLRDPAGGRVAAGHMVFAGNPGTGKTTVARLLARQLHALGILPSRQVHDTTASKLIQGYVGQTTVATRQFLQVGLGKVIFIDEAHQLAGEGGPGRGFGRDALNALVPFAEDHRQECVIVLAGYPQSLRQLLNQDPGMASRFPEWIVFEDYTPQEMVAIFDRMLQGCGVRWPAETCWDFMCEYFAVLRQELREHFGNARTVRQVVEECRNRQANRLQREGRLDAADVAAREATAFLTADDLPSL